MSGPHNQDNRESISLKKDVDLARVRYSGVSGGHGVNEQPTAQHLG